MADDSQPNGDATPEHNIADLNKLIRAQAREFQEIKKERAELNERAADMRQALRDAGVNTKAFEYACKLVELEAEARHEYLDQLRINFDALGVGQQADMFEAPEQAAAE